MLIRLASAALAILFGAGVAQAEVAAKAPDGFAIHIATVVKLDRDDAWADRKSVV